MCSNTRPSVDSKQRASKLHQGSTEQTGAARNPGAGTSTSPFKIFRSSERKIDSDDSADDSSNSLPHTPAYTGVDVEELEMPVTESGENAVVQQMDTETKVGVSTMLRTTGGVVHDEPLMLMPGASNTIDTLFGEVSDSSSGPSSSRQPPADNSCANENSVVPQPTISAKLPHADVEEGEITDSDSEEPESIRAVADKENTLATVTKTQQTDARQRDCNRRSSDVNVAHCDREKASKSTSCIAHRRTSSEHERKLGSGQKSDNRKRSPQLRRTSVKDDRRDCYSTVHKNADRTTTSCRSTERRLNSKTRVSPRKNTAWSRTVNSSSTRSAKQPYRRRRDSSVRPRTARRRF